MKRIYSHPNIAMVQLAGNELENLGIETAIHGERTAALIGGGAGIEAWNELWIFDESREHEAALIIKRFLEDTVMEVGKPWTCPSCGQMIEPTFSSCWNCGAEKPDETR